MSESTEHQKTAGAIVYLMEELGDARMRCDQLLRYIEKAGELIEKSSHKDHFFEVAGGMIRGIPETAFKLHKALEAVALAANYIDYEEIKQDLRPEKVEELERVLEDVRIRQVQRRSLPMVNPASVVEQLKGLAKQAREEGRLDTDRLGELIAALEMGAPKTAEDAGAKAAAQLEAMAHALENPPEGDMPSRVRLAQVLRKTLGEHVRVGEVIAAGKLKGDAALEFETALLVLKKVLGGQGNVKRNIFSLLSSIAKGCSLLGQEDLYSIIWKAALAVNQKWSAKDLAEYQKQASDEDKTSRFEEGKPADPTKDMSPEDAKAWKENTEEYGDKFKKEAVAEAEPRDVKELEDTLDTLMADARLAKTFGASGNYKKMFFNIMKLVGDIYGVTKIFDVPGVGYLERVNKALMPYAGARPSTNFASSEPQRSLAKDAAYGVSPAPEKLWKSMKKTVETLLEARVSMRDTGDKLQDVLEDATGLVFTDNYNDKDVRAVRDELYALDHAIGEAFRNVERVERGLKKKVKQASQQRSRFEEGKPADPTKDMSEEDAEAWKENTEEYGDKFKSAGLGVESFGTRGKVVLEYIKGGHKRREGPFDPRVAERRLVALVQDGSVSEAGFERKNAADGRDVTAAAPAKKRTASSEDAWKVA